MLEKNRGTAPIKNALRGRAASCEADQYVEPLGKEAHAFEHLLFLKVPSNYI